MGRETLQLAVNSAVISYNDGLQKFGDVFRRPDIEVDRYFVVGATLKDRTQICNSNKRSSETGKKRRKLPRAKRIDAEKKQKEKIPILLVVFYQTD